MISTVREIASYRACNNDLSFGARHVIKQTLKGCGLVKTAQGGRNLNSWPGLHDCASTLSENAHLGTGLTHIWVLRLGPLGCLDDLLGTGMAPSYSYVIITI